MILSGKYLTVLRMLYNASAMSSIDLITDITNKKLCTSIVGYLNRELITPTSNTAPLRILKDIANVFETHKTP